MDKKKLIIAGAVAGVLGAAAAGGAALAHHAFAAEFDGKAPVLLRGAEPFDIPALAKQHVELWLRGMVIEPDARP